MSDKKFQNKYRIQSARATWHDYGGGAYFVTVRTKNGEHYFGEIVVETGRGHDVKTGHGHNVETGRGHDVETGRAPSLQTQTTTKKMKKIDSCKGWLSVAIGGIKSAVTKFANENGMDFAWQTRFHDRIIRDQIGMNRIVHYIENNPAMWDNDCYNEKNNKNDDKM